MASILVVEDVPAVLMSLRIVLQGKGHQVTGATDGNAGIARIGSSFFDLVITDIWMPGSSGTEVIRQGKQRSPKTRFLAITGGDPNSKSPDAARQVHEYGADRVLHKPFQKEELLSAVDALLGLPG